MCLGCSISAGTATHWQHGNHPTNAEHFSRLPALGASLLHAELVSSLPNAPINRNPSLQFLLSSIPIIPQPTKGIQETPRLLDVERQREFTGIPDLCAMVTKTEHVQGSFNVTPTSFAPIIGCNLSSKQGFFSGQDTITSLPSKMLESIWQVYPPHPFPYTVQFCRVRAIGIPILCLNFPG